MAETEKYEQVTFFSYGGMEKKFEKEEQHPIDLPKVVTYDKQPKMSVASIADKVAIVVCTAKHEFIKYNFAPPDMVGFPPYAHLLTK